MTLSERIDSLSQLGTQWSSTDFDVESIFRLANHQNNWFTTASLQQALDGVLVFLKPEVLTNWTNEYKIADIASKRVGVVMAGNIPMVGFHDWLCVLVCGHTLHAKLSSQDQVLIKALSNSLIAIDNRWKEKIIFTERLNDVDAIIATGSDNSARYFHYYFANKPHIIRKNRNSIAVLTGEETPEQIQRLGTDIFSYYGLGCRSVSKIYVPQNFTVAQVYDHLESFHGVLDNHKYQNNYDYNRSILLLNKTVHFDNGFLLMVESTDLVSPIGVLYFERYQNLETLSLYLESQREKIQVIATHSPLFVGAVDFGNTQFPNIMDYADGVDTIDFLLHLS